jgi:poly(3-hydroxyalkanoate) synthetase
MTKEPEQTTGKAASEDESAGTPRPSLLWPFFAATSAATMTASIFKFWSDLSSTAPEADPIEMTPDWATPNEVRLELPTMRLRDFSTGDSGQATLICAPYALHTATIADFAPGHSVVQSLMENGQSRVLVTDWRSASPEMRFFSIDSYLADLNVAIDEIGAPVDLVGLCQGGWMALVYAARFPDKVRRLVLAGAPVDIRAAASSLSRVVVDLPTSTFDTLVRFGEGRILGKYVLKLWGPSLLANETDRVMQEAPDIGDGRVAQLEDRFDRWYACVVNLPGTYYLQVVHELFKENKIAEGRFVALGRRIDLTTLRAPIFLLAGRDDELIHPEQLFATARLVGTLQHCVETELAPCSHLSLFLGARTLTGAWRRIAQWLLADLDGAPGPRATSPETPA